MNENNPFGSIKFHLNKNIGENLVGSFLADSEFCFEDLYCLLFTETHVNVMIISNKIPKFEALLSLDASLVRKVNTVVKRPKAKAIIDLRDKVQLFIWSCNLNIF